METQVGSKIRELLSMKGKTRLCVKNDITFALMNLDPEFTPGIRFKFLETKEQNTEAGDWYEYNLLLEIDKYKDTVEYVSYIFKGISRIIKNFSNLKIDSIGISEVDGSIPEYYYVLIYILSDGKDNKSVTENDDFFRAGGGEEIKDYEFFGG